MLTVEEQAILKSKKRKFEECKKAWEYSVPNPNLITLRFVVKNRNPFLRLIPIICDPRQYKHLLILKNFTYKNLFYTDF